MNKNWIDDMVDNACKYYNGRDIVLWGKYDVSDTLYEEITNKFHWGGGTHLLCR